MIFANGIVNVLSKGKRSSSPGQGRGGKARGQFGQAMPRGLEGATETRAVKRILVGIIKGGER